MKTFLLPIADRKPLGWILGEQRTAFPPGRAREAQELRPGDRLLLYTTRGCFHNPTRDRGRIIGLATVTARSSRLRRPVRFGDREYTVGVQFSIERLAPRRQGVELAPLVPQLASFPNPRAWSGRMRRALVPLTSEDANLLVRELEQIASPYPEELAGYAA
jgi:hypothetical protein